MNDENPQDASLSSAPERPATRKPWVLAVATGAAGVVVGGVLGATLSSAGAADTTTNQQGPGTGQMQGGPGGEMGGGAQMGGGTAP